jgi:hypothetical protein
MTDFSLSRTPSASLASSLIRYASLFADGNPEEGMLLCLVIGVLSVGGGTALGMMNYLDTLGRYISM